MQSSAISSTTGGLTQPSPRSPLKAVRLRAAASIENGKDLYSWRDELYRHIPTLPATFKFATLSHLPPDHDEEIDEERDETLVKEVIKSMQPMTYKPVEFLYSVSNLEDYRYCHMVPISSANSHYSHIWDRVNHCHIPATKATANLREAVKSAIIEGLRDQEIGQTWEQELRSRRWAGSGRSCPENDDLTGALVSELKNCVLQAAPPLTVEDVADWLSRLKFMQDGDSSISVGTQQTWKDLDTIIGQTYSDLDSLPSSGVDTPAQPRDTSEYAEIIKVTIDDHSDSHAMNALIRNHLFYVRMQDHHGKITKQMLEHAFGDSDHGVLSMMATAAGLFSEVLETTKRLGLLERALEREKFLYEGSITQAGDDVDEVVYLRTLLAPVDDAAGADTLGPEIQDGHSPFVSVHHRDGEGNPLYHVRLDLHLPQAE